jgi:PmbA protein
LIEGGRLRTYLHDSYTARRQGGGQRSTANASRSGYRSAPSVSTSNLIVAPGDASLADLLAEAGDGVYVTDVAGLHSGVNPVSGQFSVGASGVLIDGGELAAPANEFTIASDLVSMLSAIQAAGAEARWVPFGGSVKTPPLLIGEMAVGGT